MDASCPLREVKLCLLGESGVGKSSLVMRFVKDSFKSAQETTVGASFLSKKIVVDGQPFQFQIWDTAGQERYRSLAPMYYRGASAAIVVYDITRAETFAAVRGWVKELQKNGSPNIVLAIAGNKCDLADLREVHQSDTEQYAQQMNAIFIETSALTANNVPELFYNIARKLPEDEMFKHFMRANSTVDLKQSSRDTSSKSCCGGNKQPYH